MQYPAVAGGRALHLLPSSARGVLLAMLASFFFGLAITTAFAVEYHTISGLPHGWVAGGSPSDGSFFARADGASSGQAGTLCYIDSAATPYPTEPTRGYHFEFPYMCNAWSRDFFQATPTECHWRAYVGDGAPVAVHHHYADDYCG